MDNTSGTQDIGARIRETINSYSKGGRRVLMTDVTTFSGIAKSFTRIDELRGYRSHDVHTWKVDELLRSGKVRKGTGRASISSFLTISRAGGRSKAYFDFVPTDDVVQSVFENMMLSDGYTISFEVFVWDDGLALVSAHYNAITGSRYFAVIDSSTLPELPADEPGEDEGN